MDDALTLAKPWLYTSEVGNAFSQSEMDYVTWMNWGLSQAVSVQEGILKRDVH